MKTLLVLAVPMFLLAACATNEEQAETRDGRRTQTTQGVGIGFGDNYVREGDPLSEHQQYIQPGL